MRVPEISVQEVARKRTSGEKVCLLDVREIWELERANMGWGEVNVAPCSEIAEKHLAALPPPARKKEAEIVVICHHGVRSAQVAGWLLAMGWTNVKSMAGGIDAYAREIDPQIGFY